MTDYTSWFRSLGLEDWCNASGEDALPSLADLAARSNPDTAGTGGGPLEFPSLDVLHESCKAVPQSRDFMGWVEDAFLAVKDPLKVVLDPLTQPLSWALEGALAGALATPWWLVFLLLCGIVYVTSRSWKLVVLVLVTLSILSFLDLYSYAIMTLAIIFVCTTLCLLLGIPMGIAMSRSDRLQKTVLPVLDMLQTLPTFVYLIPLIFLFSVTEPKLYGIAIILYAIVPVVRLTDLGIRLVDPEIIEASEAFGMSRRQRLFGVELPLATPTIMAGVNQTIMMSLAMVVIASLVSAPGLGTLVLRGISRLELGVGLVSGLAIVMLAIMLDRTSKGAMARMDRNEQ
ncbi:MAG: ABC transporter permease subunit [Parvularcula sp.]|nr:ABC transporter permease subunit [Parvularcula sp.]